jgi:hypothetical protein
MRIEILQNNLRAPITQTVEKLNIIRNIIVARFRNINPKIQFNLSIDIKNRVLRTFCSMVNGH